MKRLSTVLVLLLTLGMVAPVVFATGVKEAETKELNVLMTPQEEWCQGMKQEFEKLTGIRVNYVRMSSGEALARIRAEKNNPQFDIWWGGPIDSFIAAKIEGLLEPYNSPNYANLLDPEKYKDKENYWVGIYVGSLGFATNKNWLAANPGIKAPTSWQDLLRPEFKGQIMVAHPSTSGTSYTALATILQIMGEDKGWDYIKKYAAHVHSFTKSGAAPAKFVGQGEAAVGVVFSHDIVNEIENNKLPLELTFPSEGTGYEIGGMGLIKGGKNVANAKKWFDWAITAEAQALGPKYKAYQAPTVKGVKLSHPELLQVKLIAYDFQWAGKNKKAIVDKFTNEIAAATKLR
ncbi:MAG: ABC transporter substrate-binding protein [Spirochaetales bacterium]